MDDGITVEKVSFENAVETLDGMTQLREKRAVPSQNAFRWTSSMARGKGMKVNSLKTNLLTVSDAQSYRPVAFIEDKDGNELRSTPGASLKVLGFTFRDRPTVRRHVESVIKKFRQRYWTLYNLKKNGFTTDELVTVYKTMVVPVADYGDVVCHSLLTDDLDYELDLSLIHI